MRFLLLLTMVLTSPLMAQPSLVVEASKKTTKTGETGSTSKSTSSYVDRVTLNILATGDGHAELAYYFVARNAQTHALSYFGFDKKPVSLSRTAQKLAVQSEPLAYSQSKARDSTPGSKRGVLYHGWVVVVTSGGQEAAVQASAPEVLSWVRKNPPRLRTHLSP
jgi:hypothetical protein